MPLAWSRPDEFGFLFDAAAPAPGEANLSVSCGEAGKGYRPEIV